MVSLLKASIISISCFLVEESLAKPSTSGYAPSEVECPAENIIRPADDISNEEKQYVNDRLSITQHLLRDFIAKQNLRDINLDDHFDVPGSLYARKIIHIGPETQTGEDRLVISNNSTGSGASNKKHGIKYGVAVSGGGFRSTFVGAGMVKALDGRNQKHKSSLSGLLDAATHMSALSGGGWLLSTMYNNDFQTVEDIMNQGSVWNMSNGVLCPEGNNSLYTADLEYYAEIAAQVLSKAQVGFPVTMTDIYGRLLSAIFFEHEKNQPSTSGLSTLWSDIVYKDYYKSRAAPYPILLSVARMVNEQDETPNDPIIEITPQEFGSFDATLHAFANLKYLGTPLENNVVQHRNNENNNGKPTCIRGYDNIGFITGTTSSIFDKVISTMIQSNNRLYSTLGTISEALFDPTNLDVAVYQPNPFHGYINPTFSPTTSNITRSKNLQLVDGAFGGENVPMWPLLYKPRGLDAIFVIDVSGDSTRSLPSGRSLIHTYARVTGQVPGVEEGYAKEQGFTVKHFMPPVSDENSFINLGLTTQPTFFGCRAKDFLTADQISNRDLSTVPPLLIYLANTPVSYAGANASTFKMSFTQNEIQGMVQNGFDVVDQSDDPEWPKCVSCALLQRDRERQGMWEATEECQQCFNRHCWNGALDPRDYNTVAIHNDPQPRKH